MKIRPDLSRFLTATLPLLICLEFSIHPAFAWGRDGHRLVAKIAVLQLNPTARVKLEAIFNVSDDDLAEAMAAASTWPDEISKPATKTGNWHFIDVPVNSPFSLVGLCGAANDDCVTFRITDFADRLRNNTSGFKLPTPARPARPVTSQEAAFLIHFVGDIHQPLHAATDGDRGGNCVNLTQPIQHDDGSRSTDELHAAWDIDTVLAIFDDLDTSNPDRSVSDEDHAASILFARYQAQAPADWEQASVQDWAKDSNNLARTAIYDKLGIPNHTSAPNTCAGNIDAVNVDPTYLAAVVAVAEDQIMKAGIRLADVLNAACAGDGCAVLTDNGDSDTPNPPHHRPRHHRAQS